MARTTSQFLSKLKGGGSRPNKFRVICPFPTYAIIGGETEDLSFLAKAAQLPSSTLGVIEVPFNGRKVRFAGDRIEEPWSITVLNDTDFKIRNAFERWQNGIRSHKNNVGLANMNDYVVDVVVEQLDMADNVIKTYTLESAWIEKVGAMELSYDSENQIGEFTVDFIYQNFISNTTT